MNGFKVFNPDWTCKKFQYEVGKTYEECCTPDICNRGFHFCKKAVDCFNYYSFDPANKVAEVIAHGEIVESGIKCATNKIEIVREIPWAELLELVNTGKANTGNYNSGYYNSGNCNSGKRNSGDYNSGDYNTGKCNSGDYNTGDYNSGYYNSGDWNKTSFVAGCFNTESHDLLFFDCLTKMTFEEWHMSDAYEIMCRVDFRPTNWILKRNMTPEEKLLYPGYETTGGCLKIRDNGDCYREWWRDLTNDEKKIVKEIPNFNSEKFMMITGIDAT